MPKDHTVSGVGRRPRSLARSYGQGPFGSDKGKCLSQRYARLCQLLRFRYTTLLSFMACDIVGGAKVPFGNSRINSLRTRVTSIGCTA